MAEQLLAGLTELHRRNIVHRDIKPENILLDQSPENKMIYKIADLGLAKELKSREEKMASTVGTKIYFSPEIIQEESYTYKTDIFSLGCLIYELCALKHPFSLIDFIGCPGVIPFL